MPRSDLYSGILLMLFGLALLVFIIPAQTSEGGDASISPALLPQICAVGITGLALLLTLRAAGSLRRGVAAGQSVPKAEWLSATAVLSGVIGAAVLFHWVSPALAAGLLVAGLMLFMGERRMWLVAGLPLVLLGASWFLFYQVLGTAIS